ncbi:UDP-glucuronosyltransferase 2A3-like [Boleophthalmus pectinirostris]|uniref:UDP-glucuronosyltransferase 2A3-like n=1 Tax=Boleophthalmus pectinirostris TaxID=150288 RepID=UPI0024324C96|nr:UDP-glucuronosyltransferase 2A3-like [Boleophthalmus pectinirostris]
MLLRLLLPLLCTCLCSCPVSGGKVLVFPLDGSHWVNMKVLLEELHTRGHEVTVLRPLDTWYIKAQAPFYRSITINASTGFSEELIGSFTTKMVQLRREGASVWTRMALQMKIIQLLSEIHYQIKAMMEKVFENQTLMQELRDTHYDLMLTDPAVGGGVLLAHKLKLPLVFNVRWLLQREGHDAIAPTPLSYVLLPIGVTDRMNFLQRLQNMLIFFFMHLQIWYVIDPNYKPFVHKHFGPEVHYMELFQSADIWLMRNDFTFEFPRPTMPNVVYMSGFQCKEPKALSPELEAFVQSAGEHGVIIMTLGTLVAELPHDISEEVAAAFAQLPQKIIWRHKGRRPSTVGNNTLLVDWLPQTDLLAHPQTRLFVAHGGTNGLQEAIHHGVPLVGLPLMFDQHDNFFRMQVRGVAKVLDISTVNREVFLEALKEVLHEPKYRENMKRLSALHRDQPLKPLDRAMFWIEFVMRHGGAKHLVSESYKLSKLQYYCLDVAAFLLALVALSLYVCTKTLRVLWGALFSTSKSKTN